MRARACPIVSDTPLIIEYMFDELSGAGVIDAIGDSARAENMACARRLAAIGRAQSYRVNRSGAGYQQDIRLLASGNRKLKVSCC